LAEYGLGPTASIPWTTPCGLKPDRLIIISHRALIFVFFLKDLGAGDECTGVVGIKLDCRLEVCDRAVMLALSLVREPAVVEGLDIVSVDLDRLIIVLDSEIIIALQSIGVAAIIVSVRKCLRGLLIRI
jgi:hypothetical protein